jgi:CubicO group peptidase (beta-lactamase class C family)
MTTTRQERRRERGPKRDLRRGRAWLRRVFATLIVLVLVVGGVFGWAWASTDRSSIARAMWWMEADVDDQYRFPSREIVAGDDVSPLTVTNDFEPSPPAAGDSNTSFDRFLSETETNGFLVVHDNRLVTERYPGGMSRGTRQTSFSVAKSFVSALVGLAIDEGAIDSVSDPVTEYVPELLDRDPRFAEITLRDLLSMSSGLRYEEQEIPVLPYGDDIDTYYGTDLRELALEQTEVVRPPGTWLYNNYTPLLLGLVLERATGMSVSEFMSTRLWLSLGAEWNASWSLDSEASGFEKMESGLNATPIDYARFGLLFLHRGEWNGTRIVPEAWVEEATTPVAAPNYGYFWWIDAERPGRFYALGNFGQYIYVAPDADAVIVRTGSDWGVNNSTWLQFFRETADELAGRSE